MITHNHTATVGRTPLDEGSARRRDLYPTTHNTYKRQTSMPQAGFEPANPADDRLQTNALDRSATGVGLNNFTDENRFWNVTVVYMYYRKTPRFSKTVQKSITFKTTLFWSLFCVNTLQHHHIHLARYTKVFILIMCSRKLFCSLLLQNQN